MAIVALGLLLAISGVFAWAIRVCELLRVPGAREWLHPNVAPPLLPEPPTPPEHR